MSSSPHVYSTQAWCPSVINDYLLYDFGQLVTLTGVLVQGGTGKYTPVFKVSCSGVSVKTAGGLEV